MQPIIDDHDNFVPAMFALWQWVRYCRDVLGASHPADMEKPWVPLDDIPLDSRSELVFAQDEDGKQGWDGEMLQRHMDSFMVPFLEHIPLEFEQSLPDKLRLAKPEEIAKLYKAIKPEAFKTANLHVQIPLFFSELFTARAGDFGRSSIQWDPG
jgi:hypothetical protein